MHTILRLLLNSLSEFHPDQHPPTRATEQELAKLRMACRERLNHPIPDGYAHLLAIVNGFIYNGLAIYATHTRELVGERSVTLEGFVDTNAWLRVDRPDYVDYLVFGHGDMDYFVFRISDGSFLAIGRGGEGVFEEYASFEEMITAAITRALQ